MLTTKDILEIIPHRNPFLLVDKVVELVPAQRAVGIKNITASEPWFQGHFPDRPIMPGVLMIEALAQLGAICILSDPTYQGKLALFAGLDKVRFKRIVTPGDTLTMEIEILRAKGTIGKGAGKITVAGEIAVTGELMFALQ